MMQDILYDSQYSFGSKHAICEFTANTLNSFDNDMTTIGVFLDLSKALDRIDHTILLKKLSYYGIRGLALEWCRSYLSTRKQFITYKDILSECMDLTCRVPQGSVLGPLLCIIYTNDLPNSLLHSTCILFADDKTIYYAAKNIADIYSKLDTDLTELSEWFEANKLTWNISKTNYVIFSKSTTSRNTNLHGSENRNITHCQSTTC